MSNNVKHGKRYYKQMALEVAVRNPERYENILKTFAQFEGITIDDDGILDIYSQLYMDGVIYSDDLGDKNDKIFIAKWIRKNCKHNNEWGYPTGYQAAFTRYLKTLSEFGFIYAQYKKELKLSPIAKALVNGNITLSEAFAVQCMRFWRKSPYRRVLNDFNFFEFIIDSIIELKRTRRKLSYNQFMVGLFSDDGDVSNYLSLLEKNKIGASQNDAYNLVYRLYNNIDNEHGKIPKIETAFRDYGNTVFRVLYLTGFITVEYSGILTITTNEERISFYNALKELSFSIPDSAKEDEEEYFKQLGTYDSQLENLIHTHRERVDYSTKRYNEKLENIIKSYKLTVKQVTQALHNVSAGNKRRDIFWFIQDPVKFEFLITIFVYMHFKNKFTYKPNYICDEAGIPYSHAPGNIGDIEIFNKKVYWLIEATLIRSKNQQINNETVNLFRHIDKSKTSSKYITLVAPYIHEDTKLIFDVATLISIVKNNAIYLYSDAQTTEEFINRVHTLNYFESLESQTLDFATKIKTKLISMKI